jgi:hypothetical protein
MSVLCFPFYPLKSVYFSVFVQQKTAYDAS